MKTANAYFLLSAIIRSVTASCKKDEPVVRGLEPHLRVYAGHDMTVNLPADTFFSLWKGHDWHDKQV